MTQKKETELFETLCQLTGEQATRLFIEWHGTQLLDDGFLSHVIDGGYMEEEEEEEEENCTHS